MVDFDVDRLRAARRAGYNTYRRMGRSVFIGGVLPLDSEGILLDSANIEAQTHATFQNLDAILKSAGLGVADLVRLNTYYVGNVPEGEATSYWERMTRVRLRYLILPGPAAMAVRVEGTGIDGALIELEAEATPDKRRQDALRIMPTGSWDWSIPVPFSQGWRIGNRVWVGGQVSADDQGRAVYPGDAVAQTRNVMRFIRNVLQDAGATVDDLCHLKICYQHTGDTADTETRLGEIMQIVRECCGTVPTVTAFGANLLYGGLVVEIDAVAIVGASRRTIPCPTRENMNWTTETYGVRQGKHIQFGGYSPASGADDGILQDIQNAAQNVVNALSSIDVSPERIARLNVFHCATGSSNPPDSLRFDVTETIRDVLGCDAPPITLVRAAGLPGQSNVQLDGSCLTE